MGTWDISTLDNDDAQDWLADFAEDGMAWSLARLEAHYFRNQRFEPDDLLLEGLPKILPGLDKDVARVAALLCKKYRGADIRVITKVGTADGWKIRNDGSKNMCR